MSPLSQLLTDFYQTNVQTSIFALVRNPQNFHKPLNYKPERWLPSEHPLYDSVFAEDALKSAPFFSLGTRACLGREVAWMEGKLFMAKVLWRFDVLKVPGQKVNLEESLLHYGFFEKPECKVRFVPVH